MQFYIINVGLSKENTMIPVYLKSHIALFCYNVRNENIPMKQKYRYSFEIQLTKKK